MIFELAFWAFIIFGGFAIMCVLADYILPALFDNDGIPMEWKDNA